MLVLVVAGAWGVVFSIGCRSGGLGKCETTEGVDRVPHARGKVRTALGLVQRLDEFVRIRQYVRCFQCFPLGVAGTMRRCRTPAPAFPLEGSFCRSLSLAVFFRIFLGLLFPKLEFPKGGKFVFGLPQVLLAFGVFSTA